MTWNVAQAEVARVAEAIADGTASAKDLARMADANISRAMAARIAKQYEQHAVKVKSARFANSAEWTDAGARQAFDAAMTREANAVVLTAGHGDKPLFMSHPLGAAIAQFRSFVAASHEKILISNLQKADADSLMGVVTALGFGAVSYTLYSLAKGEAPSSDPGDWVSEALDRSAMPSWFKEANQILSIATGRRADYNRLLGATKGLSRRRDNTLLSEAAGPALGHVADIGEATGHAIGGTANAQDVHAVRQALPLQNLMGARILFDQVENGFDRSLGFQPRKH